MRNKSKTMRKIKDRISRETDLGSFESFSLLVDPDLNIYFMGRCTLNNIDDKELNVIFPEFSVLIRGIDLTVAFFSENELIISGKTQHIFFNGDNINVNK